MSTELIEIIDKHGYHLELYDSTSGCTLFLTPPGKEKGFKFDLTTEAAMEIITGLRISRNLKIDAA